MLHCVTLQQGKMWPHQSHHVLCDLNDMVPGIYMALLPAIVISLDTIRDYNQSRLAPNISIYLYSKLHSYSILWGDRGGHVVTLWFAQKTFFTHLYHFRSLNQSSAMYLILWKIHTAINRVPSRCLQTVCEPLL